MAPLLYWKAGLVSRVGGREEEEVAEALMGKGASLLINSDSL